MVRARKPKASSTELTVDGAGSQLEFRKTNEAIGLRVVEGKLTLLIRKMFNVLMLHAQHQKVPGVNAPIESATAHKYFWIPLPELARDASYDSNDTAFLKQQLEEMQDIKLRMENDRQWTSERLISSVTLVNPKGLKNRGGMVWLGFAFPPEVHENVMAPGTYTKLALLYQGMLRSGPALALYEICRRYATNPTKVTAVYPYEHWYGLLTGNPDPEEYPAYKYFKRDVIKLAIAEVNALTDIEVELIEYKVGRRIAKLQFRVEATKQPQLEFPGPPVIDVELLEQVMKMGFTQADASDIIVNNGDAKLRLVIAGVNARIANTGLKPLGSVPAYFRWALRQDSSAAFLEGPKTPRLSNGGKPDGPTWKERFLVARANDAIELYKELDAAERDDVFEQFKAQTKVKIAKREKALEHNVTKTMLGQWYATDLWGEPTAEDILSFADRVEKNAAA